MVKLIVGGDFCPIGVNKYPSIEGDGQVLFGDLLPIFLDADCAIVNLETPLIEKKTPIPKTGPVLGAPVESIAGLKAAGIDMVNLANNHIMDHGEPGLEQTLKACNSYDIATFGAGKNRALAGEFIIREYGGVRIAFTGMAEHEFSIAGESSPGANPLDLINYMRELGSHSGEWDYLVVLLHTGVEHYPFPSPAQQKICRFLTEAGAKLVVCQHSHCSGCYEEYLGAHIIYGQGNLLFDLKNNSPAWNQGFLVIINIDISGRAEMELIPHYQSPGLPGVRRMNPEKQAAFFSVLAEREKFLKDSEMIRNSWNEYCSKMELQYLNGIQGYGRLRSRINNKLGLPGKFRSRKSYRRQLNYIRCESHREALLTILEKKNNGC